MTVPGAFERAEEAARVIRARCGSPPETAVVLGSGLGDFAGALAGATVLPYGEIPGWPLPDVKGHAGRFVVGETAGRRVAVLSGRVHRYEGVEAADLGFSVRVLGLLGVRQVVLTNAAGGISERLEAGALMIIDDHLNLLGVNPLAGPNDDRFGPRFPDMTEVYARRLREAADAAGAAIGVPLRHGVYAAVSGPSYETPAEIRLLRAMGADAVGMSTVPEAIVARHMGIDVLGLSCITNMAAGVGPRPLHHEEVLATAHRMRGPFAALLEALIARL